MKCDSSIEISADLVLKLTAPGSPVQRIQLDRLQAQMLAARLEHVAGPASTGLKVNTHIFKMVGGEAIKEKEARHRVVHVGRPHRVVKIK